MSPNTLYTVVDAFAGAGGLSVGFHMAGYRALLAIEMDLNACRTYRTNLGDTPLLAGDIRGISDDTIVSALHGSHLNVLAGGPPCQPFSTSGKRRPGDHRAPLLHQMVRLARLLRPDFLLLENVTGLLTMPGDPLGEVQDALDAIGYGSQAVETLVAAAYGVPQTRERLVLIANRHKLPNPYPRPLLAESDFVTVDDAISDLTDLPADESLAHVWPKHSEGVVRGIAQVGPGESLYPSRRESWRRLFGDQPAPTVKSNHGGIAIHPRLHRVISIREMARLQGFPDDFEFPVSRTQAMKQIGNAVPPPLAQHIALAIRTLLDALSDDIGRRTVAA